MKKIKMCLSLLAMVAFAMTVQADSYLYWMAEDFGAYTYKEDWTYARVKLYDVEEGRDGANADYLTIVGVSGTDTTKATPTFADDGSFYAQYATIGSGLLTGNGTAFILELFNDKGGVAVSAPVTWAEASASIYSDMSGSRTELEFGPFYIPEPTSGLMMLLGVSVLALRRKRKLA